MYRKQVKVISGKYKGKEGTVVGFTNDNFLLVREPNMKDKFFVHVSEVKQTGK